MASPSTETDDSCNITAYTEWHSSQLENDESLPLTLQQLRLDLLQVDRSDKEIWRTMNFDEEHEEFISLYGGRRPKRLNITKGQAMEASSVWCQDRIRTLKGTSAGGHGPPSGYLKDDYHGDFLLSVHETMCNNYCLGSDYLRAEGITASRCNCLELSTNEEEISYTGDGDFCLKNSGHLLCESIVEYNNSVCVDCKLEDFTCARRKYNAIEVPLKGRGDECNQGMMKLSSALFGFAYLALAILFRR